MREIIEIQVNILFPGGKMAQINRVRLSAENGMIDNLQHEKNMDFVKQGIEKFIEDYLVSKLSSDMQIEAEKLFPSGAHK